jgi:hypothetical protein
VAAYLVPVGILVMLPRVLVGGNSGGEQEQHDPGE